MNSKAITTVRLAYKVPRYPLAILSEKMEPVGLSAHLVEEVREFHRCPRSGRQPRNEEILTRVNATHLRLHFQKF